MIRNSTVQSIAAANESYKQLSSEIKSYPNRNELDTKLLPIKNEIIDLKIHKAEKVELEILREESKERDENSKQRDIRIENKLDKLIYMHLHANIDSIKLQYISPIEVIECYSLTDSNNLVCKK